MKTWKKWALWTLLLSGCFFFIKACQVEEVSGQERDGIASLIQRAIVIERRMDLLLSILKKINDDIIEIREELRKYEGRELMRLRPQAEIPKWLLDTRGKGR